MKSLMVSRARPLTAGLTPASNANSHHFQWQSTSTKAISRSHAPSSQFMPRETTHKLHGACKLQICTP